MYLWSLDNDAVVAALALFRCLCDEAEILYGADEMPPEYMTHSELASATNLHTAGRAALQKSIGSHLRRCQQTTVGCEQVRQCVKYETHDRHGRTLCTIGIYSHPTFIPLVVKRLAIDCKLLNNWLECWHIRDEIPSHMIMNSR